MNSLTISGVNGYLDENSTHYCMDASIEPLLQKLNPELPEIFVNGKMIDRFRLLALALMQPEPEIAWEYMKCASCLFHPQDDKAFNALYGATAMELARKQDISEFDVQHVIKNNIKKIFGEDAELLSRKSDGKNIPDVWIRRNEEDVPIEVKFGRFDKKALRQLSRYMHAYGCAHGIAIASTLTVTLPENIQFISHHSFM